MPYKNQDYGIPPVNLTMGSNASASGSGGITINNNNEIIYTPPVVSFTELNGYGSFTVNGSKTFANNITTIITNLTASTSNPLVGGRLLSQNISVGNVGNNYIDSKIVFASTGLYLITGQFTCFASGGRISNVKLRLLNNNNSVLFTSMAFSSPDDDSSTNLCLSYLHKVTDTTVDKLYFDMAISNTSGNDNVIASGTTQINIIKISNDI